MRTDCLIGVLDPDQPATVRVRYVQFDGGPGHIPAILDRIWSHTCSHDAVTLADRLLAHQWSYLDDGVTTDTAITFTGEQPVPGIGMASDLDADRQVEVLPLRAAVEHVSWVYVIDPTHATVTVHNHANLREPFALHRLTDPAQPVPDTGRPRPSELFTAVRDAGTTHGLILADTWALDAFGGTHAQAQVTALRVLTGDPAAPQALPDSGAPGSQGSAPTDLADVLGASDWSRLTPVRRSEVLDAWRAAVAAARADRTVAHCRRLLAAVGGGTGRDLSSLHPDRLRVGGVGVFAGDWAAVPAPSGQTRLPVGFVGVLTGSWNGFAVFTCTRQVAEAIVADQQLQRERHRTWLIDRGRGPDDADREVDESMATMRFDGDTIVVDETAVSGDPDAVTRIEPDPDGQYSVMGGSWTWQAVDPHDCENIIGVLPAPGAQQQFVELPHTGLRVPHDRLRVTDVRALPGTPPTFVATLALDDTPVAEAHSGEDGFHLSPRSAAFGRDHWTTYLSGCRQHGRPASDTQVLAALITEHRVGQAARQATTDGAVLTRLVAADGTMVRLRPVWPAPRGYSARTQLGQLLQREDPHPRGHLWQWWTGTTWKHLAAATDQRTTTDPRTITDATGHKATLGQLLAHIIAESLYERLDRDQLIKQAAGDGIPLDRQMSDDQIRALLRAAHRERGRDAGLPVDDLPTLTADQGLELGRIATGGAPTNPTATTVQPTPSDPDQPPTH
ncbi:hypothetical protein [Micromonospora sp. NBC_01813]|uniref:hypothetical protein n=1 Tax=Micromonospora sp. NBC_01813 TaxID=2975988 RepID=UPI002DD9D66C|nr:hypothetical protein [Micromonospora sp. NBC_01813]WSA06990.1 hypothetical protein OG958_22355 [Micromonospora sp. NBC_01813]